MLALGVVVGHAPAWGGGTLPIVQPLPPYYCVQAFFLISGFYMALLQARYQPAGAWIFWSNRYSRLIVSYWIIAAATLGLAVIAGDRFPFVSYTIESAAQKIFTANANVTLVGIDWTELFSPEWSRGLVIPPAWSLGAELTFYLLVPLLWRVSDRTLVLIALASLSCRLLFVASGLPFWPWQQRFFPCELMFFVLGMLAFRWREHLAVVTPSGGVAQGILVFFLLFSRLKAGEEHWQGSLVVALIFFCFVPATFEYRKVSRFDRAIGDLSYPVYLVHVTVGCFAAPLVLYLGTWFFVAVSIVVAAPISYFVEQPLDRWRAARLTSVVNAKCEVSIAG
jgi:peptidoglycan/LPS O-acetylase OafA/YrhL